MPNEIIDFVFAFIDNAWERICVEVNLANFKTFIEARNYAIEVAYSHTKGRTYLVDVFSEEEADNFGYDTLI